MKNVPGRKTDLAEAQWLADVAAHGMVRPSFVPPPPIRALRELTRYRKTQIDARARALQRLEKVLQDAGIKLTSVASTVWSKSSRDMIEAMISGERDPVILAGMARQRLRTKIGGLEEALNGHFDAHHGNVCRAIIAHIDFLDRAIAELNAGIDAWMADYESAIALLTSIPGVQRLTARVMVAEMGMDMSIFPTLGHLCAWEGVAPASYESAGRRRPAGSRRGDPWLKQALVEAAKAAARTRGTYLGAHYRRISRSRRPSIATLRQRTPSLGSRGTS